MRKVLSLILALALLALAAVPVHAVDAAPAELAEEVYHTYMYPRWEDYDASLAEYLAKFPQNADKVAKNYADYCKKTPMADFFEFSYCGSYQENALSVWVINDGHLLSAQTRRVGDYILSDGCVQYEDNNSGVLVYTDGKLIDLVIAYEQGVIDDSVLAALSKGNYSAGCVDKMLVQIGDMDYNDVLDVADIMSLKDWIMQERFDGYDWGMPSVTDFNRDGYVNVGDIMGLKNYIMSL